MSRQRPNKEATRNAPDYAMSWDRSEAAINAGLGFQRISHEANFVIYQQPSPFSEQGHD